MKLAILDDYQQLALKSADWERLRKRGVEVSVFHEAFASRDDAAMLAALHNGKLGHATLDVYGTEPLPADHPLRKLDNVTLSPHLGYVSEDVYRTFWGDCVENVEAWLDGKPVRVLNPESLS